MNFFSVVLVLVVFLDTGFCGYNDVIQKRHPKDSSASIEYYTKPNQDVTIYIMIHIDRVLTKKLYSEYGQKTRQKLKLSLKEIMKKVEYLYLPLNQKIHLKLLDTRFLKNNSRILTMDENVSKYLKSYCEWQSEKKKNKWYYSVLLTGLDLFYLNEKGKEVKRSTGRGFMNGMCNLKKSCAVLEWHPKNIAYLLAHEIGHSLGMSHDGPPNNQCKSQGHIMAAKYDPKSHPETWTQCSKRALKRYLLSKKSWCLRPDSENKLRLLH